MTATLRTIQKASEECELSPNTLRIYERLGFLAPARDSAGRRLFSDVDIAQAKAVAKQRRGTRGSGLRGASGGIAA